jgi:alpha-1,6-mannosyltransferase
VKIVDVTEFWSERGGGVRAYLTQLLREGALRGHDVAVIAPGARDEEMPSEGGRVIRLRGPAMPYDPSYHALWNPIAIRAAIERERPDVLEVSSPYVAALVATRAHSVALRSLVVHSDFIDTYARPVLSRALGARAADVALAPPWAALRALTARFDVTVCSGRWLADKLLAHGCQRVVCVPFGIRHGDFSPSLRDPALRARLLGPARDREGAALVAVVGRLAVEKRVPLVFESLAKLGETRPVAAVVLGDGPERPRVEALAKRLGLFVNFEGFVTDRARYAATLASADVLVHGCACETFGFSVAEALASGVAVVVPDAGGASEFADPDAAERYPADATPVAVSVATSRLLGRPREARCAGALRAASRVRSAGHHFDALFALYEARLRGEKA